MTQWGNSDDAANSVLWAPALVNKAVTRTIANTMFGNTTADAFVTGETIGVYGVSVAEARAARAEGTGDRVSSPGWQLRKEGSGGRANRVTYETLVAMSNGGDISGDASDDAIFEDYVLTVVTNPSAGSANAAAGDLVTFVSAGSSVPSGASLTYQWEVDPNANGTYEDVSGETSANLSVDSNSATAFDGALYRNTIISTGADTVTTASAIMTVTGRALTEDTPATNQTANAAGDEQATYTSVWSVAPVASPTITYQWTQSDDSGNTYVAIMANTVANSTDVTAELVINANVASNGTFYKCTASVNGGDDVDGTEVDLTIT